MITDKKITLDLVGVNGNSFAIIGTFQKIARREGWENKEIDAVLKEATSQDYDHLLSTIMEHCK